MSIGPEHYEKLLTGVYNNLDKIFEVREDVKYVLDKKNNSLIAKLLVSGMTLKEAQTVTLSYLLVLENTVYNFDLKK